MDTPADSDGEWRDELNKAIRQFQARCELPVNGETDEQTWKKLEEVHDNVDEERTNDSSGADFDVSMDID